MGLITTHAMPSRLRSFSDWIRYFASVAANARLDNASARYRPSGGRTPTLVRPKRRAIAATLSSVTQLLFRTGEPVLDGLIALCSPATFQHLPLLPGAAL